MKIKLLAITTALFVGATFWLPAFAAEPVKEVKAAVAVAAIVPSKVCPQYSSVTINVTELLADASQKATITVRLKDCSQVEMADIDVWLTTERGAIDSLKYVDEDGQTLESGSGVGLAGKTDANGFAFFQIYSKVPGKTKINTKVDNMVDLDSLNLTFKALPFPKYVTVVVEVPKIISPSGEITIFKPSQTEGISPDELVDLGVRIIIPFWVIVVYLFFATLTPVLFVIIIILIAKIKKMQKKEVLVIEETEKLVKKEEVELEELEKKNGITPPPPEQPQT